MPDNEFALTLEGVGRAFGPVAAVRDVSLSVEQGAFVCLVGPSGCGKSTLLRLIAGVETPDAGRIAINGQEVSGPGIFVEPEVRRIGFVFQDYALFPHLTVLQNVMFGLKRLSKSEATGIAEDVLGRVGIAHLADRHPHMLSGGEQQRVALARALAPKPDILLMDEPFSNLDRGLREALRDDTLALLRSLGTTLVMVTHDPEEALSASDRVVLMRDGRIAQQGSGYDLYDRPESAYVAEFFCAFNRVPGTYRDGAVATEIGTFPMALKMGEGSAATLFVPPQGIAISLDHGNIPGQVEHRRFHGEVEELAVRVDGLHAPLRVRTTHRLPPGTRAVRLSIEPARLHAFATDETGQT